MAKVASASVIVVGASVRAAAWSALRAGLQPACVDRFADLDLRRVAAAQALSSADYPEGLARAVSDLPAAPWFFTGALENRPGLIERISRRLPLWGNGARVLRRVRSPFLLAESLRRAGLPCPAVRRAPPESGDRRRFLLKPRFGAGGRGIAFWSDRLPVPAVQGSYYFQEWIDGQACAAAYVGLGDGRARFLGATRQFIGLSWLGAGPFQYCGSAGPLPLTEPLEERYQFLGNTLARDFDLRGLFGVDCVVQGDVPLPVEINPRYTASMEIIEWAGRQALLAGHAQVFGFERPTAAPCEENIEGGMLARAVVFAKETARFPQEGPWCETLARPWQPWTMPEFADIPAAGQQFQPGQPMFTMYARGENVGQCVEMLEKKAQFVRRTCLDLGNSGTMTE